MEEGNVGKINENASHPAGLTDQKNHETEINDCLHSFLN